MKMQQVLLTSFVSLIVIKTDEFHLGNRRGLYLNDGRVLGQGAVGLRRLTDSQVFDVAPSKDDVFKDIVPRSHWPVCGSILSAKGFD